MNKKLHPLVQKAIDNKSIVEDAWKYFAYKVIPNVSITQFTEMRKAFYCGFYASFTCMFEVSTTIGENDEEGAAKILENIKNKCEEEINKFANFISLH